VSGQGLHAFLWGALTTSALVAALIFLRFWKLTQDRLFLFFSSAFVALSLNWALAMWRENHEYLYFLRLAAFVLIIIGIVDKNRHK
jgi:uncharacterized membrane protein YcjF (UPF0283 family)